ncbi:hypothetical protein DZA28_21505 [Pseudomonas alloputida]|uniref:Uncharacterized protein n=3 Tax=Pseudomonas TaxID=286 RepID=A0ACC9MYV3_9PSED|nr:hypothetical protein [Pseudomonas hunanensis]OUS82681.1 hypothetical protein CBP06_27550 [Pseudomonas putida]TRZ62380.1 hypothetical protein DZA28_21505 [Pseudomonas alloputida]OUS85372.1 hypothetical protein CBP05_06235 [Pseudomonas putida]PEI11010.1 hypothetical protein CRM86_25100 [Pseudomonas putida]
MGAGVPAKQATRCMAPATPVFAGTPAPTGAATRSKLGRPLVSHPTQAQFSCMICALPKA